MTEIGKGASDKESKPEVTSDALPAAIFPIYPGLRPSRSILYSIQYMSVYSRAWFSNDIIIITIITR